MSHECEETQSAHLKPKPNLDNDPTGTPKWRADHIHVCGLFGPSDSRSGLPKRYWSHVCRCAKPTIHVDTYLVTDLHFRKKLNLTLDHEGKEDMEFREWWEVEANRILREGTCKEYLAWRDVMWGRVKWVERHGRPL